MMEIPESIKKEFVAKGGIKKLKEKLPKDQQIRKLGTIFWSLSGSIRIKILILVNTQPVCVCILKKILNIADSKLSYHLSALMNAGLVYSRREGKWRIYYLTKLGKTLAGLFAKIQHHQNVGDVEKAKELIIKSISSP